MNERKNFSNLQRRNSAVMAKYEWTSSLMNMKKTGNEIHDRRSRSNRTANEFLQGLLQKRSDGSVLDDNGTIDRYERFLKFKANFNDDDMLNEFNRRLRGLSKERRQKQTNDRPMPIGVQTSRETMTDRNQTSKRSIPVSLQTARATESLKTIHRERMHKRSMSSDLEVSEKTENDAQLLKPTSRNQSYQRSVSADLQTSQATETESYIEPLKSTATSTNSLVSNITVETNPIEIRSSTTEYQSSSSSSSDYSMTKTLHRPTARRADGTEVSVTSPRRLRRASSDILIFHHCHFPRSLKPRESIHIDVIAEKQESPSPTVEQYDRNQVFHLLDQIENESSPAHFATMLDQLTTSTVQIHRIDHHNEDVPLIDNHETISIHPNLFDQSAFSQDYYTTVNVNIDDPKKVLLYTMTIGIVQLSPSRTVPYSILNGRRPLLQSSVQTNFRQIHCKQPKHISQVTAIDSTLNTEFLQENDIILKINDQSVWHLSTKVIQDLFQQSNACLLTIARLCQPFI